MPYKLYRYDTEQANGDDAMKINKLILAAVMVAAPGLAQAYECGGMKQERVTMSCAPGTTFDAATSSCVALATS